MSPSEELYRLIASCYEATSGEAGWSRFAAELARALSATGCATVVRGTGGHGEAGGKSEAVLWAHGDPPHPSGTWQPASDGRHSPRMVRDRIETATSPQSQILIGTLCRRNGASHMLIVARSETAPPFGDAEFDLVAEILPHLARALQLYRTIRNSEGRHEALSEIMDRLPEAIFLVDRHGVVLASNGSARAIARQNDGLFLVDDRISLARPSEQASLRALIAEAGKDPPSGPRRPDRPAGGVSTMSATRPSGRQALPIVVTPVLCRSGTEGSPAAVAAVITKDAENSASVLAPNLATAFDLTPGEARLAGLIADGFNVLEAAKALGITRNTARTHLKRIYAKTSVHSQADLVRLLSRGTIELRLNDSDETT